MKCDHNDCLTCPYEDCISDREPGTRGKRGRKPLPVSVKKAHIKRYNQNYYQQHKEDFHNKYILRKQRKQEEITNGSKDISN